APSRDLAAGKTYSSCPPRSSPAACRQTGLGGRPYRLHTAGYSDSLGTFYSTSASSCRAGLIVALTVSLPAESTTALIASSLRSKAPSRLSDTVMARKLSSGRSYNSITPCRAPVAGGRRLRLRPYLGIGFEHRMKGPTSARAAGAASPPFFFTHP